jgi:pimeloyl-ACP methyl ester carboxylesterase
MEVFMQKTMMTLVAFLCCFKIFSSNQYSLGLNNTVQLSEFGEVKFKAPKRGTGPTVLLLHGIYAGSTHITWKEMAPLLERAGAKVFIVDLPGTGANAKSVKQIYNIEVFDRFIENFIEEVIKVPTSVVTETVMSSSALTVAAKRPDLIDSLVLISPTGINSLAAPSAGQTQLFPMLWNDEAFGENFYNSVFEEKNLRFFLEKTVFDDSLITADRIKETQAAGKIEAQKWITLSFVGGKITRSFAEASMNTNVPTLLIFGEKAESPGSDQALLEKPEQFLQIRPDFNLKVIANSGQSTHREKPQETADTLIKFIKRN